MKVWKYILLLCTAAFLSGCLNDSHETPRNGDAVAVEFTAVFEGQDEVVAKAATRAMSADQEDYVETLDVLVFEYDEGMPGQGRFLYATHGYDIKNTAGSNTLTFKAMLATKIKNGGSEVSLTGKSVYMLALANSRGVWNDAAVSYGESMASVVEKLVYSVPGKWDASASTRSYFPMASLPNSRVTVSGNMSGADFGKVYLVRAVTAINIGFNCDGDGVAQGFDNFKLDQVVLGRFPDRGYVSNRTSYSTLAASYAPSDLALVDKRTYQLASPSRYGIFNEMYVPLVKFSRLSLGQYPYILVGGYFSEQGSPNTTNLTWYKVEMPTTGTGADEGTEPTERNFKYLFKIDGIDGPGYATQAAAAAGAPNMWANMTIVPWSKSKHDAELDGPYTFDVSQTDFFLDCRARPDDRFGDNVITLSTDYAYGWTVVEISDESGTAPSPWLDVSALHGAPFENGRLVIRTTMNTGSNIRTGYIYLSAGRWKYIVKVTQGGVL